MREILFKAKRKDWKKLQKEEWWIEGYYRRIPCMGLHEHYIMPQNPKNRVEQYEIDVNTLCQYTGLTDKNGNKIWENDIAYIRSRGFSGYGVIKYQNGNLVLVDEKRERIYGLYGEWKIRKDGNIFDNADLLEVK